MGAGEVRAGRSDWLQKAPRRLRPNAPKHQFQTGSREDGRTLASACAGEAITKVCPQSEDTMVWRTEVLMKRMSFFIDCVFLFLQGCVVLHRRLPTKTENKYEDELYDAVRPTEKFYTKGSSFSALRYNGPDLLRL